MKHILSTIICLLLTSTAWSQQWRLQKILTGDASGILHQKHFVYSDNRGSDYKNGIINFDSSFSQHVNVTPWHYYSYEHQKYDEHERQVFYVKRTPPGTDYRDQRSESKTTSYTSSGKISRQHQVSYAFRNNTNPSWSNYYYDSLDRLVLKVDSIHYAPSTSLLNTLRLYYYDTNGNLSSIIKSNYNPPNGTDTIYEVRNYYYDSNNVLVSEEDSIWQEPYSKVAQSRQVYTYDSSNRVIVTESFSRNLASGSLKPMEKSRIAYNSDSKVANKTTYRYDVANQWSSPINTVIYEYQYNNDNDIVSERIYDSTNQLKGTTYYHSYNSLKQPDTIKAIDQDGLVSISIFVYEIYWPAKIIETTKSFNTVSIFPNPSSDIITIQAELPDNKEFTVSIIDMQGRLHKQWNEAAKDKNYLRTVPVPDLPPGNYILQMKGNDFKSAIRFSILR